MPIITSDKFLAKMIYLLKMLFTLYAFHQVICFFELWFMFILWVCTQSGVASFQLWKEQLKFLPTMSYRYVANFQILLFFALHTRLSRIKICDELNNFLMTLLVDYGLYSLYSETCLQKFVVCVTVCCLHHVKALTIDWNAHNFIATQHLHF